MNFFVQFITNKNIGGFILKEYLENLNLIDLISEKHKKLRKITLELWIKNHNSNFSETEMHLLSMLIIRKMTIAESARKMNISRQGVHKFSKILLENDYILFETIEGNHKEKLMALTPKGIEVYNEMVKLKTEIENQISNEIGEENIKILKNLLLKNWI